MDRTPTFSSLLFRQLNSQNTHVFFKVDSQFDFYSIKKLRGESNVKVFPISKRENGFTLMYVSTCPFMYPYKSILIKCHLITLICDSSKKKVRQYIGYLLVYHNIY